jgi:hypothetical protein
MSRSQFTNEFQPAAVRRLEQGVSVAEAARALKMKHNVNNVPGKKTDVEDFRPADEICAIRLVWRDNIHPIGRYSPTAYAESARSDERATASRHQASCGRDRLGHRRRDLNRRARSANWPSCVTGGFTSRQSLESYPITRFTRRNEPPHLRADLYRAVGASAIITLTAEMVFAEIDLDDSRFPTDWSALFVDTLMPGPEDQRQANSFVSNATTQKPGGARAADGRRRVFTAAKATSVITSAACGARMATPNTITAAAHNLARIVYYMVTTQREYDARCSKNRSTRKPSTTTRRKRRNLGRRNEELALTV